MNDKMNSHTRGQAAIEFLTTYGWAILIVMVAIGALATFGIMNPSKYLADKCLFSNNIQCVDYQLTTTQASVVLVNGLGTKVYNVSAKVSETGDSCTGNYPEWSMDQRKNFNCSVSGLDLIQKDKGKVKLIVTYQKISGGFTQTATGELYTTVQ